MSSGGLGNCFSSHLERNPEFLGSPGVWAHEHAFALARPARCFPSTPVYVLPVCSLANTLPPFPSSAFFLRVTRSETGSPKNLTITPQQQFPPEGLDYYVWFYEGSQFYTMLGAAGLVRRFPLSFSLSPRSS